jgi:hypothetical protein
VSQALADRVHDAYILKDVEGEWVGGGLGAGAVAVAGLGAWKGLERDR